MMDLTESQKLARDLADALGGEWHWEEPDEAHATGYIFGRGQRQLNVFVASYGPRKAEIRGAVPSRDAEGDYFDIGGERPSIGVSLSRSIDAIARDVQRRLLPEYEETFQKATEAIARRNEYLSETTGSFESVLQAAPELDWRRHTGKTSASFYFETSHGDVYGDVQVHGESVNLDLHSVDRETAVRILRALVER